MNAHIDTQREAIRNIVTSERDALIRIEVKSETQRAQLQRAVVEAIRVMGCGIDEVSDASGLSPTEIQRLLNRYDAEHGG
jgi:hypothetical protein